MFHYVRVTARTHLTLNSGAKGVQTMTSRIPSHRIRELFTLSPSFVKILLRHTELTS